MALPALAIGAGGAVLGGLFGALGASARAKREAEAARILGEIREWLQDQGFQASDDFIIDLASIPNVERWHPETFEAVMQEPSLLGEFQRDAATQENLQGVLTKYTELSESGLSEADMGMFQSAQMRAAQAERAQREAALMDTQSRGTQTGGSTLAANLMAAQNIANTTAEDNREIARIAQERALTALANRGNLAGGMLDRDFSEAQGISQAVDAVNKRNADSATEASFKSTGAVNDSRRDGMLQEQSNADRQLTAQTQNQNYAINRDNAVTSRGGTLGNIATGQATHIAGQGAAEADIYGSVGKGLAGGASAVDNHFNPKPKG